MEPQGQLTPEAEVLVDLVPEQQQAFHGYFFFSGAGSASKVCFMRSDQFL